jgi:hypothetical protein
MKNVMFLDVSPPSTEIGQRFIKVSERLSASILRMQNKARCSVNLIYSCCLLPVVFHLGFGDTVLFRNVGIDVQNYTVSQPRSPKSASISLFSEMFCSAT